MLQKDTMTMTMESELTDMQAHGRTDGRTEILIPISHSALDLRDGLTSKCNKKSKHSKS